MMILFSLIMVTMIAKTIASYKYLGYREDSYFSGPSTLLDPIMSQEKRVRYIKLYMSSMMLPIFSKEGDQKLKAWANYFTWILYAEIVVAIGFYILIVNL